MSLKLDSVCVQFGGLKVVESMNLTLGDSDLVGLIGPNGAGKTTVFNLVSGIYKPTSGRIFWQDRLINNMDVCDIAVLGIARTFQNIRLFANMSVVENILVSKHKTLQYSIASSLLRTKWFGECEDVATKKVVELLKLFGLERLKNAPAGSLPYGVQRKVEILRALAGQPKLLLLDEPAAGMNNAETQELSRLIGRIRKEFGLTILLIEHDMKLVMDICERIVVLDHGVVIADGEPEQVRNNQQVIEAYLGVEESENEL